jgi:hypothetical protein
MMSFKESDPNSNNKNPKNLRKKYGIDENFGVDYSNVSKTNNLNLEMAKAFECEPHQIAISLAEITPYTKYIYIPDIAKRTFLAENTDNPDIQLCLAMDKNIEVIGCLAENPHLPKKFVNNFTFLI